MSGRQYNKLIHECFIHPLCLHCLGAGLHSGQGAVILKLDERKLSLPSLLVDKVVVILKVKHRSLGTNKI